MRQRVYSENSRDNSDAETLYRWLSEMLHPRRGSFVTAYTTKLAGRRTRLTAIYEGNRARDVLLVGSSIALLLCDLLKEYATHMAIEKQDSVHAQLEANIMSTEDTVSEFLNVTITQDEDFRDSLTSNWGQFGDLWED